MGRVILLGMMALLAFFALAMRGLVMAIVNALVNSQVNNSRNRPPLDSTPTPPAPLRPCRPSVLPRSFDEPDLICSRCYPQMHDGGKKCQECSGRTSSSCYDICHRCAFRGYVFRCENCKQRY